MSVVLSGRLKGSSIGHLKSRRGCKTCKIRRVKCGEEKPHCARCTSTGRKCEYEGSISIFDNPLSLSPNTVWRERRFFAYYFQHVAASIGGELDLDFWSTIVPQVCRSEPAVWDAIIAISALFESPEPCPDLVPLRRENSRTLNQNHRDALGWYARSVSAIRQRIERGRLDIFVGLISCILFICIEALHGGVEEAAQLYRQGVHLIVASRAQLAAGVVPTTRASLLEGTIVPIFIRLGAIAFPIYGVSVSALLRDTERALTSEFVSLKSAREAMALLATEVQLFQHTCVEHLRIYHASYVPHELINRQKDLSVQLSNWHIAFTNLMESLRTKDGLSPQQIGIGALLLAYHEMQFTILLTCSSPLESITDAYLPNFQNIVEQCSIALDATARSDGTQPPFTFEMSLGIPLWFTCLRCREPRIRRTALALLRRAPQVQGFYKCHSAVTFGERIMALEERYGMAMNTAQGMTNSMTSISTNAPNEYPTHNRGESSDVSRFDFSSFLAIPDSEHTASRDPMLTDLGTRIPTASLIPEEARVGPIGIFRPRDGFPPGTTEKDIAKWNRNHDQIFLRFTWNERDPASNSWKRVHGYIPTTV